MILTATFTNLKQFYKDQHFHYADEILFNLYNSLKTKPFVILSGVSGSGKSKIIDLFATYFAKELSYEQNYELVPVKPNWTDSRALFGYHNIVDDTYTATPVIQLFLRALANPTKPYFLVLDEMNLAKVEHYFSDFLSVIESRKYEYATAEHAELDIALLRSKLGGTISLSQAIILSALQLGSDNFETVETYRSMPISQEWLRNSTSNNPEAQFRTELNQGRSGNIQQQNGYRPDGDRLAGRAFYAELGGNSYKLKPVDEMDVETRADFERVKRAFDETVSASGGPVEVATIKQDKITLHFADAPLKTSLSQRDFRGELYSEQGYYVPNEIEIPLNVFVVGTVNVDETTYMFSPKVLDRSNVMEFNEIDLFGAYGYGAASAEPELTLVQDELDLAITLATAKETTWLKDTHLAHFEVFVDIFNVLKKKNKHFGYRVFNEMSSYVYNYLQHAPSAIHEAIDNQILQKILPKINGDVEEIGEMLEALQNLVPAATYKKSAQKLAEMMETLETTHYVTFIK